MSTTFNKGLKEYEGLLKTHVNKQIEPVVKDFKDIVNKNKVEILTREIKTKRKKKTLKHWFRTYVIALSSARQCVKEMSLLSRTAHLGVSYGVSVFYVTNTFLGAFRGNWFLSRCE